MILIIVGVIAGVLVVCGLIALVIFIVRRKSNSKDEAEAGDNYVSLEFIKSNVNEETQYQSISSSPYQSLGQGVEVAQMKSLLMEGLNHGRSITLS
jgi:hypothetical protein